MGKNVFATAVLGALLCGAGLLFFNQTLFSRLLRFIILVAASAGVTTYTAHLGGQVRSSETRPSNAPLQESKNQQAQPANVMAEE